MRTLKGAFQREGGTMFTMAFRRRRRIRALILGLAVTLVAMLGVSVMGASVASAHVPPISGWSRRP